MQFEKFKLKLLDVYKENFMQVLTQILHRKCQKPHQKKNNQAYVQIKCAESYDQIYRSVKKDVEFVLQRQRITEMRRKEMDQQ